jgi:hypothetical protein
VIRLHWLAEAEMQRVELALVRATAVS